MIFHVVFFSSSSSKDVKLGIENWLSHSDKKNRLNDSQTSLEKHVIQSQLDDESQDESLNKGDLGTRVRNLHWIFEALKIIQKLTKVIEKTELWLSKINEKLKCMLNIIKTTLFPEKTRWTEKSSELWRLGFTSQFNSCRSIKCNHLPEVASPQMSDNKLGEQPSRILFSNPSKHMSRFLLWEFINENFPTQSEDMHSLFEKKTLTAR